MSELDAFLTAALVFAGVLLLMASNEVSASRRELNHMRKVYEESLNRLGIQSDERIKQLKDLMRAVYGIEPLATEEKKPS